MMAEGGDVSMSQTPKVLKVKKGQQSSMMKKYLTSLKGNKHLRSTGDLQPIKECNEVFEGGNEGDAPPADDVMLSGSSDEEQQTHAHMEDSEEEDKWHRVTLDLDALNREQVLKEVEQEK